MKIKISSAPCSAKKNKTGGWRTYVPNTDLQKCIGCARCSKICPEGIIEMINIADKIKPKTDYDFCKGCGLCASECPVKAIEMSLDEK